MKFLYRVFVYIQFIFERSFEGHPERIGGIDFRRLHMMVFSFEDQLHIVTRLATPFAQLYYETI